MRNLDEELVKPALEKTRRMLEKARVPLPDLGWERRAASFANVSPGDPSTQLDDPEILLDTMCWVQIASMCAQAAATSSVRPDVRELFLDQRERAMEHGLRLSVLAYRLAPSVVPPQVQAVGPGIP